MACLWDLCMLFRTTSSRKNINIYSFNYSLQWTLDSEGNGKSNNKKKNGKTQKLTPAKRRASTVSDEEEDGEINDEEDNEEEEKEEGQGRKWYFHSFFIK